MAYLKKDAPEEVVETLGRIEARADECWRPLLILEAPANLAVWALLTGGILAKYGRGTTQGYVRVEKISGNNPFPTYGVINDGGARLERSDDGAYLPARE